MAKKSIILFIVLIIFFISGCEQYIESNDSFNGGIISDEENIQDNTKINYLPSEYNAINYLPEELESLEDHTPGYIIIKFKEGTDINTKEKANRKLNEISSNSNLFNNLQIINIENIFQITPNSKNYLEKKQFGLDRIFQIEIPENTNILELIK